LSLSRSKITARSKLWWRVFPVSDTGYSVAGAGESDQNRPWMLSSGFKRYKLDLVLLAGLLRACPCALNDDDVRISVPFRGSLMKDFWGRRTGLALGALIASVVASTLAQANGVSAAGPGPIAAQRMWLSCENGREYPLHPLAVSREGDLVTGYLLVTGRGRGVHVRLIPMGSGYRYAGPGVWFDGMRQQAVLNWGRPDEVPCTVMQE